MKKYEVSFMRQEEGFLTVEAEDADGARELAYEILYEDAVMYIFSSDLEVLEVVAVDEN